MQRTSHCKISFITPYHKVYIAISKFLGMFSLNGQLTGEPVNSANCLVNHQSSQYPKYPTLAVPNAWPSRTAGEQQEPTSHTTFRESLYVVDRVSLIQNHSLISLIPFESDSF